MSVLWHVTFWLVMPATMYLAMWMWADYRGKL